MDKTENGKIVEVVPEEEAPVQVEPKFREKVQKWWQRNKKKFLYGGIAALGIGAGAVLYEKVLKKNPTAAVPEYDPEPQEWMDNALQLEAHHEDEPMKVEIVETPETE